MLHIWMITLFAVIYFYDASPLSRQPSPGSPWTLALALGPMAGLAGLTHLILLAASRELDARGSWRTVILAERTLAWSRALTVAVYAVNVLILGVLGSVRARVGDLIMADELAVMLPPMLVFIAGWWSFFPIERRLREAVVLRSLDQGRPLYPTPTRSQWVLSNTRHQILFMFVPLALIAAWNESLNGVFDTAAAHLERPGVVGDAARWLVRHDAAELAYFSAQIAGALAVFLAAPLLTRVIWDTASLQPGPLRDRLLAVCRDARVRARDLLVWRTHGAMVNGAVIGLAGPARYILLTDALLENLPERQVEAVMAHEVGHAACSHVPWLGATLIAGSGVVSLAVGAVALAVEHSGRFDPGWLQANAPAAEWLGLALAVPVFAGGISLFGFVSKRFEWQADAFAVKHLSDGAVATAEAVECMAGALESVAILNHIPRDRGSFRHGSIAQRQGRLWALVGAPLELLPIDRTSRRIKCAVGTAALLVIASIVWDATRTHTVASTGHETEAAD